MRRTMPSVAAPFLPRVKENCQLCRRFLKISTSCSGIRSGMTANVSVDWKKSEPGGKDGTPLFRKGAERTAYAKDPGGA